MASSELTDPLAAPVTPAPVPADFLESLDRYLSRQVDALQIDDDCAVDAETRAGLAELGAFGVAIPEADGGFGFGLAGACATVETIARHDRSVATTVGLHLGLGTRGLVAYGTAAQRARWLPGLANGTAIASFATTEPQSGSDLSRLATRAVALDGGLIRVDGQKIYVTNGGIARVITITASTPDLGGAARGQSLVVLEPGDPGLEVGAEEHKLGLRGSSTTSLYLQEVVVPDDRIVGAPGNGRTQLTHVLSWGRTIMAAGCLGTARAAAALAARHVVERRQFGKALAEIPVVRRQIAEIQARVFAMDALVAETAALELEPDRLEVLSLSTKVFCSEADWDVCDRALQLHGGSGYIEESGVPLLLRDARITRIFEGANDVLAARIGAAEVVKARGADTAAAESEIDGLVADARAAALARDGLRVMRDGVTLHRIGRLVVLRDATRAALARASKGTERDRARAALWSGIAFAQARAVLAEDTSAFDEVVVESALGEVLG